MVQNERLRNLFRKFIAHDIPDDMAACCDCNEVWCPNERFVACASRLARAAPQAADPDEA
jgi:hypothetical protein